jgi:hypothetical protein
MASEWDGFLKELVDDMAARDFEGRFNLLLTRILPLLQAGQIIRDSGKPRFSEARLVKAMKAWDAALKGSK